MPQVDANNLNPLLRLYFLLETCNMKATTKSNENEHIEAEKNERESRITRSF